jgi:hypothetical protein
MGGDESTRGWTDSKLKLTEIQLLDRVHQATKDDGAPVLYSYAKDLADDWEVVRAAADTLAAEGLINGNASHSGSLSPFLMPEGKALMQERRERRSDPRKRAVACRDALLDWCYGQNFPRIDEFADDVRAHFEGDPFSQEEVFSASLDLREKGYVSGGANLGGGVIRPQITAVGKTVVESYGSSISSYENRNQPTTSGQTVIKIKTGRLIGQLAVGDNNRLNQKTGGDAGELTELIAAVLDAAQGTPEELRVGKVMAQLELEADEDKPDSTVMGKALERAKEVADDTISEALKIALRRLIHFGYGWYLQQAGTN